MSNNKNNAQNDDTSNKDKEKEGEFIKFLLDPKNFKEEKKYIHNQCTDNNQNMS